MKRKTKRYLFRPFDYIKAEAELIACARSILDRFPKGVFVYGRTSTRQEVTWAKQVIKNPKKFIAKKA